MKPKRFIWVSAAALAIFASANFFCASCFAQDDPLNSWTGVWSGNPLISKVFGIAYGNGMFVGVGDGARIISNDGATWTTYITPPAINYGNAQPGIAYGAGMFLTFGTNNQNKANYILKSTNGISWTTIYASSNSLFAAAYGNNTWIFIGTNEIVTATMTSSNWNWTEFQPGFSPSSIAYGNGIFVIAPTGSALGSPSAILSSFDGITWQYNSTLAGGLNPKIAYGNGVFAVTGDNYNHSLPNPYIFNVFVSSNLVQWASTNVSYYFEYTPNEIAYGSNQFIGSFGAASGLARMHLIGQIGPATPDLIPRLILMGKEPFCFAIVLEIFSNQVYSHHHQIVSAQH